MLMLKIDGRNMDDEKFVKVVRLLGVYCTRGVLTGFDVDWTIESIYAHYNCTKHPDAKTLNKMAKALDTPIIVVPM